MPRNERIASTAAPGTSTSPVQAARLPAGAKLALTGLAIAAGFAIPPAHWQAHGVLIALIFAAQSLAGMPLNYLVRRLSLFLPALGLFALSLPISQGFARGGEVAATIALRGLVSFLAMLWLVWVLPFPELLATLCRFRVPDLLVALLGFMHRFSFLLVEEMERMRRARESRAGGRGGLWFRWKTGAQLIGMLLIRSMRRSERVHSAMCARGWDGRLRQDPEIVRDVRLRT
jgi:cobalt/nickel transport system permease protein